MLFLSTVAGYTSLYSQQCAARKNEKGKQVNTEHNIHIHKRAYIIHISLLTICHYGLKMSIDNCFKGIRVGTINFLLSDHNNDAPIQPLEQIMIFDRRYFMITV